MIAKRHPQSEALREEEALLEEWVRLLEPHWNYSPETIASKDPIRITQAERLHCLENLVKMRQSSLAALSGRSRTLMLKSSCFFLQSSTAIGSLALCSRRPRRQTSGRGTSSSAGRLCRARSPSSPTTFTSRSEGT